MASFKDRNGVEWPLAIVFGELPELKRRGLDLDTLTDETFAGLRYGKVGDLVDLLWFVCRKDAGGRTREEFDWSLDGEAIERAVDALADAVVDFLFRRLGARLKSRQAAGEAAPESGSRSGAGGSPESSASTPAP